MRVLAVVVVALFTLIPTLDAGAPYGMKALDSIKPLQWLNKETEEIENYCTAWAMRTSTGITQWVTSFHCFLEEDGTIDDEVKWYIGGKPARLNTVNHDLDLATLSGPAAPGLRVALAMPMPSSFVRVFSYPMGWVDFSLTEGTVSHPDARHKDRSLARYNVATAQGASGSPVLDRDNVVIGMIGSMFCMSPFPGFCPMSAGPTVKQLRLFLYGE